MKVKELVEKYGYSNEVVVYGKDARRINEINNDVKNANVDEFFVGMDDELNIKTDYVESVKIGAIYRVKSVPSGIDSNDIKVGDIVRLYVDDKLSIPYGCKLIKDGKENTNKNGLGGLYWFKKCDLELI